MHTNWRQRIIARVATIPAQAVALRYFAATLAMLATSWIMPVDALGDSRGVIAFLVIVGCAWYGGMGPGIASLFLLIVSFKYRAKGFPECFEFSASDLRTAGVLAVVIGAVGWAGTLRRRSQAIARRQSEWLRVTLSSIGDAVIATDTAGNIRFLNGIAENLTGWQHDEAIGRPLKDVFRIVNEKTRQPIENPVEKVVTEGHIIGLANHTILIAKDGTERPIDDSAAPIRDDDGRTIGVVLVFHDVSERKKAEKEATKVQEIFKLVHGIGRIGHWEWNSVTNENKWSSELEALYGLPSGGFGGTYEAWEKLLHPDDVARAQEDVKLAFETGQYFTEFRVIWPDGSVHWLEARACVLKDEHGKPARIMGVNMDITERKRIEEALQEADDRKDEFLATLAHELRNPLAPIRNGLHLMGQPACDRDAMEQVRIMMDRQLGQLVRLVDDLMDVSRISQGKIELRKARVPLGAVLTSAIETSRPLIEELAHEFTVTIPPEPISVDADVVRLAQVFSNLLNNAARYTERAGRIWLTVERQGSDVVVSVKDTGIGIPPEKLTSIFGMFSQVDRSLERARGGLGIGLSLAKRLAEMHGGRIDAHSEGLSKGAEFVVRLPVVCEAMNPRPEITDAAPSPKSSLRILIADDNRDSADSLAMVLKMMGNDVRTAYDGDHGLVAAEEFRPDVALFDIGMPKMNGYEACRRIREQPWGQRIVLIAVTGWGQVEDRRRSQEAGFDHHFVKPVDTAALMKLLAAKPVNRDPG